MVRTALAVLWLVASASPLFAQATGSRPIPRATFIADMDRQFQGVDVNRDGIIGREEIAATHQRDLALARSSQARAAFNRLDTDHNGQLSLAEFSRLAASTPQTDVENSPLARFDANKDGRITLIEHRIGTQANFDRMDTDKDGIVSVAEMKAAGLIK